MSYEYKQRKSTEISGQYLAIDSQSKLDVPQEFTDESNLLTTVCFCLYKYLSKCCSYLL